MLDNLVQKSLEHSAEKPGDYIKDGVLCCGACGKPKQKKIHFPSIGDRLVGIACDCTESEKASADDANDIAAFETMMERRRIEDSIVDPSYRKVTLADDDGANPKISKICRKYVDQWEKVSTENIGILFRGPVGTGKSFFAACIANALIEGLSIDTIGIGLCGGHSVLFYCGKRSEVISVIELLKKRVPTAVTSFPRLLNLLQNSKDRQGLLDRLSTYKLLVIDDLGVERDTGYAAEQIFAVIDARCRSNLPTIVTTNLTPQEMDAPETMQYKRIFDRVAEMCPVSLLIDGESRRIQNAQRRKEIARELLL